MRAEGQHGVEPLRRAIERMLTEANARQGAGKLVEAGRSFAKAAQFAAQLSEMSDDAEERRLHVIRASEYRQRADALAHGRDDPRRSKPYLGHETDDRVLTDEETDALEQQILLLVDDRPRRIDWGSIGGLAELKTELKFHYGLALARAPDGMEIEGWNTLMFHGPPGTGKTLLACAIANKLSATFFNVKASQIVSKWVGESGRLISTLYRMARKFTKDGRPSIVFIDEFDALCRTRAADGHLHHQQMLASILAEIDGFQHKGRRNLVMTIGATNRPWDLDAAVLSRFERRILIAPPDEAARAQIFRIHLGDRGIAIDFDYAVLAAASAGLTGREIARLCKDATARMLAEMNPEIPDLVDQGLTHIARHTVRARPLGRADFAALLAGAVIPDHGPATIDRYAAWQGAAEEV